MKKMIAFLVFMLCAAVWDTARYLTMLNECDTKGGILLSDPSKGRTCFVRPKEIRLESK